MFDEKHNMDIDEEIKKEANWLANNFSTRNGYTSMEENLIKMGEFVKNRMLDKYEQSEYYAGVKHEKEVAISAFQKVIDKFYDSNFDPTIDYMKIFKENL